MIKTHDHDGPPSKALWFGRTPEYPAERNEEYLLLAITPKRAEFGALAAGDCGVRLTREHALRLAKTLIEEVCTLDAAAVARADGIKRES